MPPLRKRPRISARSKYSLYRSRVARTRAVTRLRRRRTSGLRIGVSTAGYRFSRWLVNQTSGNMNITGGLYDTGTSVLSVNANVTEVDVGQVFTLDSLPNVSEFTTLFDQYRITRVIIQLKLQAPPESIYAPVVGPVGNFGNFYPTVWWVTDKDDNTQYTLAQIKEVQGVRHRVLHPNRELTMSFSPSILAQMYRTSLTTGYAPKRSSFIDIAQPNVPHYSNKFVVDLEGLTSNADLVNKIRIKMNVKLMFACRGVR